MMFMNIDLLLKILEVINLIFQIRKNKNNNRTSTTVVIIEIKL